MSQQIVILGGGISGLATAWYLRHYLGQDVSVKVIEQSSRAGGWIETLQADGFLFEQGPRSCRTAGVGKETLSLVEQLGLESEVIVPDHSAFNRYLYHNNALQKMPKNLWEVPFNSLTEGFLKALWRDWRMPKRQEEDESIHSFFSRRLGTVWADRLIDPFVLGIYAGDCKTLSMKSAFPLFDEWEQKKGSLLRGAWSHKKNDAPTTPFIQKISRSPLFSFQQGMETLPRSLANNLKGSLFLEKKVVWLEDIPSGFIVHCEDGEQIIAHHLISTFPMHVLADLLPIKNPLKYASVAIVNMGFHSQVLPARGFGYLVPSSSQEIVLGCVWDSSIFPQQNRDPNQTRLTFMLGGSQHPQIEAMPDHEVIELALKALHKHMRICVTPAVIQVKKTVKAIPQYPIGHEQWKAEMRRLFPKIALSGTAFTGVSLNDCIAEASTLGAHFKDIF